MGKLGFILIIAHLGQQVNTYAAQDYVRYCFVPAENEEAIVPKESERRCVWQGWGVLFPEVRVWRGMLKGKTAVDYLH